MSCPCCSGKSYTDCCEVFILGNQHAPTPEALMRSRYTAYSQANVDYIISTMRGQAAEDFADPQAVKFYIQKIKWLGLEIVNSSEISSDGSVGFVEFIVDHIVSNRRIRIREISEFHYEDGSWYYASSKLGPITLGSVKINSNDLCPCGSQIKYKKCCKR